MVVLILSLLLVSPVFADSTIVYRTGKEVQTIPWTFKVESDSAISINRESALYGNTGIALQNCRGYASWLFGKIDFQEKFWTRLYFRINSWIYSQSNPNRVTFAALNFSEPIQREQPKYFLEFMVADTAADTIPYLRCRIRPSYDQSQFRYFELPVAVQQTYCIETFCHFFASDSVRITTFLNGDSLFSHAFLFSFAKNFIELNTLNSASNTEAVWSVFTDEFIISDRRPYAKPPAPQGCKEAVYQPKATLKCKPLASHYKGEVQKAAQWQLFTKDMPEFPLFDAIETDPAFFTYRFVPFDLDSGDYKWHVSFKNNFGFWGDYSAFRTFSIRACREVPALISNLFFSLPGEKQLQDTLVPEQWYDVHLNITSISGWNAVSYVLIWWNSRDYTFGHPRNKGGIFLPESNYICNVSIGAAEGYRKLFEKYKAGSMEVRPLDKEPLGLYLDGSQENIVVDTLNQLIKVRIKLLKEALPGAWQVCAYVGDTLDNFSNIYRTPFTVKEFKDEGINFKTIQIAIYIAIIIALLIVLVIVLRPLVRRTGRPAPQGPDELTRLIGFLNSNLKEEITVKQVRNHFNLSERTFHSLLKRNNIESLPKFLNQLRIDRAKEMLKDPMKNISEIGFEVGFSEARYFSKVFRDLTGMTPSDFREKSK